MAARKKGTPRKKPVNRTLGLTVEELDELVEEAITDANGEAEQATGFYTMMENDLRLPFETEVLGVKVIVESIDIRGDDELVAVCKNGKRRQTISLFDVPLPSPPPEGAQWIAAYCHCFRWKT